MKRIWMACLSCSLLALAACTSATDAAQSERAPSPPPGGDKAGMPAPAEGAAKGAAGDGEGGGADQLQAGVLTAGVWDDNLNFDFFKEYLAEASSLPDVPSFPIEEHEAARDKWSQRTGAGELDVAFVIDTTGSMGDELSYLQAEIDDIARTIQSNHPQMQARYGLVVYKDTGDEYVTRSFDFETIDAFRAALSAQKASGGGDFPEAVPEALEAMNTLSWRAGSVARLAFWVADAPHHYGTEDVVKQHIQTAMAKDVHIYPIAASGTDDTTELTMRIAAQLTGGRYVFLTDDSGVGNAHAEPHIPCYHVTKLNSAIVRMVESELAGKRVEAQQNEIIRTVGNPTPDGRCETSNGPVAIY